MLRNFFSSCCLPPLGSRSIEQQECIRNSGKQCDIYDSAILHHDVTTINGSALRFVDYDVFVNPPEVPCMLHVITTNVLTNTNGGERRASIVIMKPWRPKNCARICEKTNAGHSKIKICGCRYRLLPMCYPENQGGHTSRLDVCPPPKWRRGALETPGIAVCI